jgi:hypothetical protein
LDELNLPYQLTGTLGTVEFDKPGIKGVTFRSDQKRLIKAALVNGRGVLQAPCGTGKTVVLIGVISAFKKERILFLCHTLTLVSQFKEELIKWGFSDIGVISGEEKSFGRIQLATIQSFSRLDPKTYVNEYDVILVDECFRGNTKVKTEFGNRPIKEINIGDQVWTSLGLKKVKRVFKSKVPLENIVKVKLSNGEVIFCSKNHLFKVRGKWIKAQDLAGRSLTTFKKYCPICGGPIKNKQSKFCSRECLGKDPERRKRSSETMRRTNLRRKKIISDRMIKNNPTKDPKIIEKMKQTKRLNGTLHVWPSERGGNGTHTEAQMLLAVALGWKLEVAVTLADHLPKGEKREYTTANGWPTCYKLDIGNKTLKLGIEVDGKGHKWEQKREKDKKKEDALKLLGWRVLHFTNEDIMTNLSGILSKVEKEIEGLRSSMI